MLWGCSWFPETPQCFLCWRTLPGSASISLSGRRWQTEAPCLQAAQALGSMPLTPCLLRVCGEQFFSPAYCHQHFTRPQSPLSSRDHQGRTSRRSAPQGAISGPGPSTAGAASADSADRTSPRPALPLLFPSPFPPRRGFPSGRPLPSRARDPRAPTVRREAGGGDGSGSAAIAPRGAARAGGPFKAPTAAACTSPWQPRAGAVGRADVEGKLSNNSRDAGRYDGVGGLGARARPRACFYLCGGAPRWRRRRGERRGQLRPGGGGGRGEGGAGRRERGERCHRSREAGAGERAGGRRRMAEPRRVPFISLSPVRRREAESPALEREPGGREPEPPPAGREVPLTEPPPPAPRESAARLEPPREPGRPEQPPQREPPRPEPPPPRQGSRQEPPPPQEALPLRQTVRLEVVLKDPTEEGCVEFSYPELLLCREARVRDLPFPPFFLLPPSASSTVALSAASSCRGVCPGAETAFGRGEGFASSRRAPRVPALCPLSAWVAVRCALWDREAFLAEDGAVPCWAVVCGLSAGEGVVSPALLPILRSSGVSVSPGGALRSRS